MISDEYIMPESFCQPHEDRFARLQTLTHYGSNQTVLQDDKGFPENKPQEKLSHFEFPALNITLL